MTGFVTYVLVRLLGAVFGLLPASAVRAVGRGMGTVSHHAMRRRRELARRHMRRVLGPDADPADVARAAKEMFASYGRYWAEVFWVRAKHHDALIAATIEGRADIAHAARDKGKGLIYALPHMGNWEVAGTYSSHIGLPVLAVAEALSNRRLVEWFVGVRNALGIDVVIAEPGSGVTKALIERLRSGGVIALLCDRDIKGSGVEVEFFGEKTTLPAGPVALADRTGATIVPVGTYFTDDGYEFFAIDPVEIPDAAEREDRIRLGTQQLAYSLEKIIRGAPSQWHLLVPNWPSDREPE